MKSTLLRQLIILPLLMAAMALLHACGSASANGRAAATSQSPQQPFSQDYVLTQGASVAIAPAATPGVSGATAGAPSLRLERVNDSRCRTGAVCVWAGYISYSFALTAADGSTSNFVLSDSMPNASPTVTQNGLTFTLTGVEPQAVPAKNEATPDYRVSLRVSNAPSS